MQLNPVDNVLAQLIDTELAATLGLVDRAVAVVLVQLLLLMWPGRCPL
ncbi:hypothetical protein [Mycobacterium uberis]|nr:hypothetical protein [Mycobacterium uberis]